ncbi:MAG: Isopentenyl phosphate kinase [Methanomassiliicoccales archaeon PtaU1.Bin124]|nr:MAG: Isopentenyl phosphate kinase [Methanomassiliicoccales archaeon PtaU1.Bin124]
MRDLRPRRIVVKVGTNTLVRSDGRLDMDYIEDLARQIMVLDSKGIETILVTSGAIGSGSSELGLDGVQKSIAMKQACAAVGQAILMMAYRDTFKRHGRSVGQVLLTYGAFSDRIRYLNLKKAVDEMFALKVIPIVNENDVIATDEIAEIFGDNDKLSALVASKMDADLLILLTDVDGLYDRNPVADKDARLIPTVDEITKEIEHIAGGRKNERSTGGMKTKINAAKVSMESGCNMVIANGQVKDVILRVVEGEELGTLFTARKVYSNKQRWILFASPKGKMTIDQGAEKAVRDGRSLLACGVTAVEGNFRPGDVVRINTFAKGIARHTSAELADLIKARCEDKKKGLKGTNPVAIENIDTVFLE